MDVTSADLNELLRWVAAGGTWEVVGYQRDAVTVALLPCTGEQEMGRLTSSEPDVVEFCQRART